VEPSTKDSLSGSTSPISKARVGASRAAASGPSDKSLYVSSGGIGTVWMRTIFHPSFSRLKARVVGAETCVRFPPKV
jgi:hypothetical protein